MGLLSHFPGMSSSPPASSPPASVTPTSSPPTSVTTKDEESGIPWWVWLILVIAIIGGGVALASFSTRR